MRVKDENKKEAIFEATIHLLNEIGFANISMSKIGKAAGVSSSTIYVYFENKEDMLKKLYLDVKMKYARMLSRNIPNEGSVRQVISQLVQNTMDFVSEYKDYFLFMEQFSTSPLCEGMQLNEVDEMFQPIFSIIEHGQKEGLLKQMQPELLLAFCYYPITQIAKNRLKNNLSISKLDVEELKQLCWDAIKA